ncbi:hypothetical protein T4D_13038 [Trichinella pseudospiralis]|uniref:Uncharacterized protein n=1 Tax=Trichinella pseudospiralis TaxID=6337 RepID=A0A0V1FL06_TRIPS|nr:hypothetical protein T4D_13038 [Trichinella pseudospiralis]
MCLSERRRLSQAEISVQFLGRQVEDGETDQFAFCLPGSLSNFSHSTSEFSERLVLSRARFTEAKMSMKRRQCSSQKTFRAEPAEGGRGRRNAPVARLPSTAGKRWRVSVRIAYC